MSSGVSVWGFLSREHLCPGGSVWRFSVQGVSIWRETLSPPVNRMTDTHFLKTLPCPKLCLRLTIKWTDRYYPGTSPGSANVLDNDYLLETNKAHCLLTDRCVVFIANKLEQLCVCVWGGVFTSEEV